MIHTFISVFYMNANGRNMSVISEKLSMKFISDMDISVSFLNKAHE
jgi:hypothetical protein